MIRASLALINKLKSGEFTTSLKVELLDKDENIIDEISQYCIDGSISIDKDRECKRNFSMTLYNPDNKFTPVPSIGKSIWFNKKIKIYIGLHLDDSTIEYLPQGVFILTKISATSNPLESPKASIEGTDKMGRWGKISKALTLKKGLNIAKAIKLVLDGVEFNFNFDDLEDYIIGTEPPIPYGIIPYDLNFSMGTERSKIVKDLANIVTWDIGYNIYGELRFKKFPDPENDIVSWTYQKEDYTLYSGSEKQFDDTDLFNSVLTIGSSSMSGTVTAISQNTDILSPSSIDNIGERLYIHNNGTPDPLITTVELAQARSDYELRKRLQIVEKQNINIIPNFMHEDGDVIKLIDNNHLTNDKYQLLKFTIPINKEGRMTCEGWKVRKLL